MAASSVPGKIYDALIKRCVAMAEALKVTVDLPNVTFTPPARDGKRVPYLAVRYMPNGSSLDGLAFDSDETYIGMLQISVFWPAGEGLVKPTDFASSVAQYWPAGLRLDEAGVLVSFDRVPNIAAALQESDLVQVPVTIRWRASEITA